MKILNDTKNNLLKRREIIAEVESHGNPGFTNVAKMMAETAKAKEDVIVIKRIGSEFGQSKFTIEALVYDSVEAKTKIEPKPKVKKKAEGTA